MRRTPSMVGQPAWLVLAAATPARAPSTRMGRISSGRERFMTWSIVRWIGRHERASARRHAPARERPPWRRRTRAATLTTIARLSGRAIRSRATAHRLPSAAMRAAIIRDGEVVVAEHPDPEPGAGEVLVRVRAAGLNGADLLQRRGLYPAPPGSPPDIPGLELAGEVAGLGPGAARFAEGDRVMGIVGGGGQAELAVVHERQLMPVPEGQDWPAAGGTPEVFTTAHDALFTQCGLRSGERLLVHGAAGGVGTAGVQLAAATGAHVTATVRNPDLRDGVRALGADAVIDPEGFEDHGPFDVVLELVGAPNLPGDVTALAIGGRIVVIGIG